MRVISKGILLYLFLGMNSMYTLSAQTVKNIFEAETPITYLGIDFTQAKLFGESTDATSIRDREFPAINNIVITQSAKYNVAEALRRSDITTDLAQVNARNRNIPVQQIKSNIPGDFVHLDKIKIDKLINTYDFSGKTGIGVLLVVEGTSKLEKAANVYVTFINMANKKVLLTERIKGKGGGFGFRNYWARSIEEVLKKVKNTKYDEWKRKYGA